jgi:hypothetical protein
MLSPAKHKRNIHFIVSELLELEYIEVVGASKECPLSNDQNLSEPVEHRAVNYGGSYIRECARYE